MKLEPIYPDCRSSEFVHIHLVALVGRFNCSVYSVHSVYSGLMENTARRSIRVQNLWELNKNGWISDIWCAPVVVDAVILAMHSLYFSVYSVQLTVARKSIRTIREMIGEKNWDRESSGKCPYFTEKNCHDVGERFGLSSSTHPNTLTIQCIQCIQCKSEEVWKSERMKSGETAVPWIERPYTYPSTNITVGWCQVSNPVYQVDSEYT